MRDPVTSFAFNSSRVGSSICGLRYANFSTLNQLNIYWKWLQSFTIQTQRIQCHSVKFFIPCYITSFLYFFQTFDFSSHGIFIVKSSIIHAGFSVYFESISLSEEFDGGCEDDFVQFGRDVFFITSYRSGRFCGNIQGDLRNWEAGNKNVTPMKERSYVELKDKEMDIWLKIIIPKSAFRIKTLEFLVTVLKKSCLLDNPEYQRCGPHPHCIQSHLFCDGLVNCALSDLPYGDFELWV